MDARFRYRKAGLMAYIVEDRATGTILGSVQRTRYGWDARTPEGLLVVEDYPGSRDVAASALQQRKG